MKHYILFLLLASAFWCCSNDEDVVPSNNDRNMFDITECYNISGSYDYLLKIHAPNMKYYQEFILNVLGTIDSLGSLESTFVMAEVKHQYGIHI